MKIIHNQADAYCEKLRVEMGEIRDMLVSNFNAGKDVLDKHAQTTEEKISNVYRRLNESIDVGGIMANNVKPADIVKIVYDNGAECFCFEVKEGKRKPQYFYCGQYV